MMLSVFRWRNNMVKLMKNYEAYLYNQHTGEVRKLLHFTKNYIKNQITKILTYPIGEFYEHKTCLGDENDVNFEIYFYNEIGEKIKPDFTTKDLNVYMKELSKHLTK